MSCNFCEIANGYVDQESFRTLMLKMMKSLVDAETSESSSSQTLPLSDNNNGTVTYFLRTYVRDYQGNNSIQCFVSRMFLLKHIL